LQERFGIARAGAILSPGNLALDPRQLTAGLLLCAIERGARCHAPTKATIIEAGHLGRARHPRHGLRTDGARPHEGARGDLDLGDRHASAAARALAGGGADLGVFRLPLSYLRTSREGRIICGGEDEDFADDDARDALIPTKTARLSAKLARLFPSVDPRPEFAWTGAFGTDRHRALHRRYPARRDHRSGRRLGGKHPRRCA
jgi:glycine/D-amino acid oxidase-like deaminating enzyme